MTVPQLHAPDRSPPPYGLAGLTAVVVLAIYLATLGPTIAFWDTAEYIAAAKVLGIPHPPGNPLFVVLGPRLRAPAPGREYAARINIFAAVTGALAAGLWFLVADRWLRSIVPFRPARLAAAFAGRAGRRHDVDGLEPVHRQREGLHPLAPLDGAGDVDRGALGR